MLMKLNVEMFFDRQLINDFSSTSSYINIPKQLYSAHKPYYKNVLCKFFVHKQCTRGGGCCFSHKLSDFSDDHITKIIESPLYSVENYKNSFQSEFVNFISPIANENRKD